MIGPRPGEGVSLIELTIVLAVSAILVAFLATPVLQALSAYESANEGLDAQTRLRYALERVAREIRQIRKTPSNRANYDINITTACSAFTPLLSSLEFTTIDGIDVHIERSGQNLNITYTLPSSTTIGPVALVNDLFTGSTTTITNPYGSGTRTITGFSVACLTVTGGGPATNTTVSGYQIDMVLSDDNVTPSVQGRIRVDLRNEL